MPRFFCGDELGAIKSLNFYQTEDSKGWTSEVNTLVSGDNCDIPDKSKAIEQLIAIRDEDVTLLTAARANGSATLYRVEGEAPEIVHEWKEPRLKNGQHYIGLAMSVGKIYTCTSNGALRLTPVEQNDASSSTTAVLPTRLRDWKLSHDGSTFAYGGDEVELSVWSIDGAFTAPASSASSTAEPRKRKRSEQLLPGEIWRAKNVANDNLDLRVPVHNTSLTYLHSTSSTSHHLVAGTQSGNVRRYDTRAARRPVADWKGMAKIGGVRNVHQGTTDNELFVSDCGCNLFAVDLRVGKIVYGYKGLAGAVASMTTHGPFLASAAQDRFVRLHSTHPPPEEANDRQENKGEVLEKTYVKVVPTIVVSDGIMDYANTHTASDAEDDADDDVWDAMENAEESDEDTRSRSKRARSAS